jgi:N,N'-diacetyllegionaminate synthase
MPELFTNNMDDFLISEKRIGNTNPIVIIAEIGVNHNGDVNIAKKLIDVAFEANADAVKFQTFFTEDHISKEAPTAEYQNKSSSVKTQIELVKKLELKKDDFKNLKEYAEDKGLIFLSTPFDFKSIDLLMDLGISSFKISSGDLTNKPLLKKIAQTGKSVILSTGMANLSEIKDAVKWLVDNGCKTYSLMQCTSSYPTEIKDANLLTIKSLQESFDVPIGFSDHTVNSMASIISVGLGVKFIEKHITLDHTLSGPDHSMSMEPDEFKEFVQNIKNAQEALGNAVKETLPCEENVKKLARKSIVALTNISQGTLLTYQNIGIKRPGTGIPPKSIEDIIGKKATHDIIEDSLLTWDDLED